VLLKGLDYEVVAEENSPLFLQYCEKFRLLNNFRVGHNVQFKIARNDSAIASGVSILY